ncbi:hypothetical protein K458DRAFT_394609 [Lentithecium fluviatile CBS 122367]|uniref:Uncharacterized protein n=1 Tax=Lentithecium fluviatile CBS 122367 TaxID=1168545 RepID=A0A6G1IL72_9PLEO|nr:hypothetical protein K458DRAFT_394609 [Lentithecium fluviatile CBS 122367]
MVYEMLPGYTEHTTIQVPAKSQKPVVSITLKTIYNEASAILHKTTRKCSLASSPKAIFTHAKSSVPTAETASKTLAKILQAINNEHLALEYNKNYISLESALRYLNCQKVWVTDIDFAFKYLPASYPNTVLPTHENLGSRWPKALEFLERMDARKKSWTSPDAPRISWSSQAITPNLSTSMPFTEYTPGNRLKDWRPGKEFRIRQVGQLVGAENSVPNQPDWIKYSGPDDFESVDEEEWKGKWVEGKKRGYGNEAV